MELPKGPNQEPKTIWNPDSKDFTVTYANEKNEPIPYTIRAKEAATFPTYIADHIAKHLAQYLVLKNGNLKYNYEEQFKEMFDRITSLEIW